LPRLKGFKYGNLYTNFVHAETLESTIKKDDFLYGKAFSDTKPMAEDPQKVAQRRLSRSTVAPGIVLGLDTIGENMVRSKKRKAEVDEGGENIAKKAKKEKKDRKEKKEKKTRKEEKDKKVRKNKQVENSDQPLGEPNKNIEMQMSVLDSENVATTVQNTDALAPGLEKSKKKKKEKDVPEVDSNEEVNDKQKKKRKKSKDNAGFGETFAGIAESGELGAPKDKMKSKKSKKASKEAS